MNKAEPIGHFTAASIAWTGGRGKPGMMPDIRRAAKTCLGADSPHPLRWPSPHSGPDRQRTEGQASELLGMFQPGIGATKPGGVRV
jgi:hypothetical protein